MVPDIYFDDNFGKIYESIENGTSQIFKFTSDLGTIKSQFIKRKIPIEIASDPYYDIITPYGYGGPIIVDCKEGKREELVMAYYKSFKQYCKKNRIVSEFIRFHPIINNALDFKSIYQVEFQRKTVGTNIKDYDDPVKSEFSKSCRKTIRKALNRGIKYQIIERPENINKFKEIYYSTMDRSNASEYYYFDDNYFEDCLKYFRDNIILVEAIYQNKVIAAGFYFVYKNILQAHLSGTLTDYLYLSPAYVIKYATANWAKENNIDIVHYGGGTSNSPDDPLYKFKKKFTRSVEFDFYVGKKVWDREVYQKLCEKVGINTNKEYFPAYRQ